MPQVHYDFRLRLNKDKKNLILLGRRMNKKRVSYFYRTATTSYLCYVPVLEDFEGASRRRLTRCKYIKS